jgi:CHAT domain-containing protein
LVAQGKPSLAREPVCVERAAEALPRALEFHRKIGYELLVLKDVRTPERIFQTNEEFLDAVPTYLSGVPNSALILYAKDDDNICAFLWRGGGAAPLYAKVPETLESVDILIRNMNYRIEETVPGDIEAISKQLAVLRSAHRGHRQTTPKIRPAPPPEHDLAYFQRQLSAIIFPPEFHDVLATIEHLTIVPIGAMSQMPIAMLRPTKGGSMVVDRFSTNYLLFAGEVRLGALAHSGKFARTLIYGNPKGNDPYWSLIDLPQAEMEARKAADVLGGQALLRRNATVSSFYQQAHDANLIYVAAHAIADQEDPLRNSYIRFADGALPAGAVKDMRLKKPLVVLSACQTGLGDVVTGGTIGFGRTFLDGGAANVVMSLWRVNDSASRYLMGAFVDSLGHLPPADALRQAQLKTREVYPKPAHWAAFSIYGNHQFFRPSQ